MFRGANRHKRSGRATSPEQKSPNRSDRVDNMDRSGAIKKRKIRGKMVVVNTLGAKKVNEAIKLGPRPNLEPELPKLFSKKQLSEFSQDGSPDVDDSPFSSRVNLLPVRASSQAFRKRVEKRADKSDGDSDSDSDFDSDLIAVEKFSSSPFKSRDSDWKVMDELLQSSQTKRENKDVSLSQATEKEQANVDLTSILVLGNFFSAVMPTHALTSDEIEKKYGSKKYPPVVTSQRELNLRAQRLSNIVPLILRGEVDTSYIYPMAKAQAMESPFQTMTQSEKYSIEWTKYFGGYYGFQRQSQVASLIMCEYALQLEMAQRKNKVVTYWTIHGFSTFVLANEVILRMIMEDFQCDFGEAEDIMRESVEYGLEVADEIKLVDDVTVAEDPFGREKEGFMSSIESVKSSKAETDILDLIMNAASDSDEDVS